MQPIFAWVLVALGVFSARAAEPAPAAQRFRQEVSRRFTANDGLPSEVRLADRQGDAVRVFGEGRWFELKGSRWEAVPGLESRTQEVFVLPGPDGRPMEVKTPWTEARQVLRTKGSIWISTGRNVFRLEAGQWQALGTPRGGMVHQLAASGSRGVVWAASSEGLFWHENNEWIVVGITDEADREWARQGVLGVAFDAQDQLSFVTRAGLVVRDNAGARHFYEGKDGLPSDVFTWVAADIRKGLWIGTGQGAIRFDGNEWHYRQGPGWLPDDQVRQIAVDGSGTAWIVTAKGVAAIGFEEMTLAQKAERYEEEIERYIKRTPYGFVAEAPLRKPADRSSAFPNDSDNDGLWTAMYGAGECFAYAATKDPKAKVRAKQAFEALRFLQVVTQGGPHSPPKGYIARTILPGDGPDPNIGRIERDREEQKQDRLWKIYEPRWPKSADGKWYWKSDTSSDELDGHYFFYPLYFEFCADTEEEKNRVREVVRGITDHLIAHDFNLVDHDGTPTRWGIYSPKKLNFDPDWGGERGLKSLSILSYLAGASYITGDPKYEAASRELVEKHGYAQNLMFAKVQHGPGSGNQSDDEMAVMGFYNLLRYSRNEALKEQARFSFYRYWANEAPEMNPFFNFAYAAHGLNAEISNPWGKFPARPWEGWHEDAMATLRGFPLDRLDWPKRNSHRLDIVLLEPQASIDIYAPRRGGRGRRVNGKVLPVENRHFGHWNTDPWRLDYGGEARELSAGTVYLLPYYLGLYHGFIERPN